MKSITWLGDSHQTVKNYPNPVKQQIGYNLDKLQRGKEPNDWKPMSSVGHGVKEIRVHEQNEYRVLYVAKFEEAIYVLHAFVKKTIKTPEKDLRLAKSRYSALLELRRDQK